MLTELAFLGELLI